MYIEKFIAMLPNDEHPLYDIGIVSDLGVEWWKNENANECNNSHSVSKAFFAAGIGILRDRGQLNLQDKVLSFFDASDLPDCMDERWQEVTIENCLQHKMGIGPECGLKGIDDATSRENIGDDFLRHIFSATLPFAPGTFRQYSDAAFYILSRIITKVTGQYADRFLLTELLNPIGFHECAFGLCPMGYPIAGGGFYARSDDVARLGYLYANGGVWNGSQIISKEWIELSAANDYAWTPFRDTDIFVKTGGRGQMVAYSRSKNIGISWHGCCATGGNDRNDRYLEAFEKLLHEI